MINEYNNLDGTWRRSLFQHFCILVKRIERVKLKKKSDFIHTLIQSNCWIQYNYIHVCIVFLCICMYMKFLLWKSTTKSIQNTKDPLQSFLIYSLALKFKMADSLSVQCHPHIPTPTLIDDARELMVFCCNTKCVWIVSFCVIGSGRI